MTKSKKKVGREKLSDHELTERKKRAERALLLRNALRFTRGHFHKNHDISPASMQSWEDVKYGGMPEGGAYTLAAAYQAEGIPVTVEWLMYGIGNEPLEGLVIAGYQLKRPQEAQESKFSPIAQELKTFYVNHQHAIHIVVEDDGLSPWITPGDYVGGKCLFGDEIKKTLDFPCIIETESGEKMVRIVRAGSQDSFYTLVCSNAETTAAQVTLKDTKLLSAAPIIRIWKPSPSGKF